jgi:hypothetical protein
MCLPFTVAAGTRTVGSLYTLLLGFRTLQKVELHPVKGGTEAVRSSTPSKRDAEEERAPQSSDSYIPPTLPASEEERLALLKALNILDTDRTDSKFKDITRLVCSAFNAPIAAVSLVDQDEFPGDTFRLLAPHNSKAFFSSFFFFS